MVSFKKVSSAFEFLAQLDVIVNFAIKSDHQLFVQGGHRLCARSDIKNREAPMPKKYSRTLIDPDPFAIRPAMRECIDHPMQIPSFSAPDKSGNPAHGLTFSVRRWAFGVRSSRFGVHYSPSAVWRLTPGVPRRCLGGFGRLGKSSRCLNFRPRKLES